MPPPSTHTISGRLFWPFARVCGNDPRALAAFLDDGASLAVVTEPEARLPHAEVMRRVSKVVQALDDPELGLKAGQAVARGDLDVIERVASTRPTLRDAADLVSRYVRLLHSGATFSMVEKGDAAMWCYRTDGLREPTAVHDFVASALCTYARLFTGRDEPRLAVHFAHGDRTNLPAYRKLFRCPIHFEMGHTGTMFPAERLNAPLAEPLLVLAPLLEARASAMLAKLEESRSVTDTVRQALLTALRGLGDLSMESVASSLGTSVATLRRRLGEEKTTYSRLLDEVRRELALSMLSGSDVSAAEVSHVLGFSDPAVYHRAFRRWTGTTPKRYRASRLDKGETG